MASRKRNPSFSADPRIERVVNTILNSDFYKYNSNARGPFISKVKEYSNTPAVALSKVWPKFAVYMLADSKYSALSSMKYVDYPDKNEIISIIHKVAGLYMRGGSRRDFEEMAKGARLAWTAAARADADGNATASAAASAAMLMARAPTSVKESAALAARVTADAADAAEWSIGGNVYADYARHLLKLLREASVTTANPRHLDRMGHREIGLISKCRNLWNSYYANPTKRNLAAVLKHLEIMKTSKNAAVKSERSRCRRIAINETP